MNKPIATPNVESRIYRIRGQQVLLDTDLADLYGAQTRILNRAVMRNRDRFPLDFMFELSRHEIMRISQIGTSSQRIHMHETDIRLILEDVKQLKKKSIPEGPIQPTVI
jgi:hypothetical protein